MKLTQKQIARMLAQLANTAAGVPCDILSAAARLAVDAEEQGDAARVTLWHRFLWRFKIGRTFRAAIDHERARRALAQQQPQAQPPPPLNIGSRMARVLDDAASQLQQEAAQLAQDPKRRHDIGPGSAAQLLLAKPHATAAHTVAELHTGAAPGSTTAPGGAAPGQSTQQPATQAQPGPGSGTGHGAPWDTPRPLWIETGLAQAAQRLRTALEARTLSRTVHETEAGHVDLSRLAQIGAGVTLRPYRETTPGRHLATCVYVMLDASGSMRQLCPRIDGVRPSAGWQPIDEVRRAALAIATACQSLRVPFACGAYDDRCWSVSNFGDPLNRVRAQLERIGGGGGTAANAAADFVRQQLAPRRERRRVALILCDGDTRSDWPEWRALAAARIDFRLAILRSSEAERNITYMRTAPHWRNRWSVTDSPMSAARDMLDSLRTMLELGAREDLAAELAGV